MCAAQITGAPFSSAPIWPARPSLRPGMLLSFVVSGVRRIIDARIEGKNLRVFLDGEIKTVW